MGDFITIMMSNTTDIIFAIFGVKATNIIHGYVIAECCAECFLTAFFFFRQTNRLGFLCVCVCVYNLCLAN